VAAEEVSDFFQRALRRAETNALRRSLGNRLQAFEAEHQVRAALGGGHCVDLVDDDGVDVDERAAHFAGEHQVQALGRRDQQVDRATRQRLPIAWTGVAGAHRNRRLVERHTQALGGQPYSHQR